MRIPYGEADFYTVTAGGNLATGDNPVRELKSGIDRDYVHLKIMVSRGSTELGFHLDRKLTDLGSADLERGVGRVRLVGNLTPEIRCVAEIDLSSMKGRGHLEVLEEPVRGESASGARRL